MSTNKKHKNKKNPNYFLQQKAFGEWKNLLEPPITFAEVLTKITVTPQAPDNFLQGLVKDYPELTAQVIQN